MTVTVDRMGSMFAHRPGRDPDRPPVVLGSHLDSQPTGGKYDGALGVLAALEVVRTLNDHRIETEAPLEVVNWTNEEGARFPPAMIASGVFAGAFDLEYGLSRTDHDGKTLGDELERIGYAGSQPVGHRRIGRPVRAAYRAGADPGGGGPAGRRGDRRPGCALVRLRGDRRQIPCRADADGSPARRIARDGSPAGRDIPDRP